MRVAPRNDDPCLICDLPDDALQHVNAEIWDGTSIRTERYRARGARAYFLATGEHIDPKTVTRHARHTESTWRVVETALAPATAGEIPVFPTDYKSMVERAAHLGMYASTKLEQQIRDDKLAPHDLVSLVRGGVMARAQQESNRVAEKRAQTEVSLIFGLAGGHLVGMLPEDEVIDVTPSEEELRDGIMAERRALTAGPAADRAPLDGGFDAIFDR